MEKIERTAYLEEIQLQCVQAIHATDALNYLFKQMAEISRSEDEKRQAHERELFRQIHSFLLHVSNVAKLLWPAQPKRKAGEDDGQYSFRMSAFTNAVRADELRKVLGFTLTDPHPLNNRLLRDHVEHFDERMDTWIEKKSAEPMRRFDATTSTFYFRGDVFNLQVLIKSVEELLTVVNQAR